MIEIIGAVLAGAVGTKIIEHLYRKLEGNEFLTTSVFNDFKQNCLAHRSSCAACTKTIKDNQISLRKSLSEDYLQKEDFREWKKSLEDWLRSIDDKVDKILEREINR